MSKIETITKEKISEKVKEQLGFSTPICTDITNQIFLEIFYLTKRDKKTMLQNFGTWNINCKDTRIGFNMHSRESVSILPRDVLRFLPSRSTKQVINS